MSIFDVVYVISNVCEISRRRPSAEDFECIIGDPLLGSGGGGSNAEGVPRVLFWGYS